MMWAIVYDDFVVYGSTRAEWIVCPDYGVQVVVLFEEPDQVRWSCNGQVVRDRQLWTGEDEYDPFGYGWVKLGRLISDEDYQRAWETACGNH